MKYYIKTFGCQMNTSDSERIAGLLESYGLKKAPTINQTDLVIFNTCGVRQSAENRAYGQIHNLREKNPSVKIILTGCLANRKDVQKRLKNKVDLFCEIKDFPKYISELIRTDCQEENYLEILPKYISPFSALVPIMTGCNNFCAYCVVPYARGREISRNYKDILKEVRLLIKNGYKDIMLLGQNVNSYGDKEINFPKLLKLIEKIPGKFWINFMSSHPKDYSDELIETIAKSKKICECIHLPIQAGSDKILAKMNRKYTAKHYLGLIRKIKVALKKHKPKTLYAITSDIIVGFPTEAEADLLESARIMEKVGYDMVFFGQFSPRPGTIAYEMKDDVSKIEKARREKFLNEILKKTNYSNNKKYVGKDMEVLIDSWKDGYYFGRTRTQKNVKLESGGKNLIGKIVKAKIIKANIWNLEAKIK